MPHHLPARWIAHLGAGVSYRVGGCTPAGEPRLMRGVGGQVDGDGVVELLVPREAGAAVLAAVAATGHVAVAIGHPPTNRTLHLKGRDARIEAAGPGHEALLRDQRAAFARSVAPFGVKAEQLDHLWYHLGWRELECVRFMPYGAWDQTPGIGAGAAIELLPAPAASA